MGGALRGTFARLRPSAGLASLRGRRGRVGARVWGALLDVVSMLSVVSPHDSAEPSFAYRDPISRFSGLLQRLYRDL